MARRRADTSGALSKADTDEWVEVSGRVVRLLRDDQEGANHQRFVIDIGDGNTLLIAHNIDLARRIPLGMGDRVRARGVYEWNELGGVLHWTHADPHGGDESGWVIFQKKTYS